MVCKYFLPVCNLSFQLLHRVFQRAKDFCLMKSNLLILFSFKDLVFHVNYKNYLSSPILKISPIFKKSFTFKFAIYFCVNFCTWRLVQDSSFFFFACPKSAAPFVKKAALCPLYCFCTFVKNKLGKKKKKISWAYLCEFFSWVPYSVQLICVLITNSTM